MESSQILGFFKIITHSIKIALKNAIIIASLTTISILLTSIIFLLYTFSSQTVSNHMTNIIINNSTSFILILQMIINATLSFAITFAFMLSLIAVVYTAGFAAVTATAASHTDGRELSLPALFSDIKTKWKSPFKFKKNNYRSVNPIHYLMLAAVSVGIPVLFLFPNPVTIMIACGVGGTVFIFFLYASVASGVASVVRVLENGCEVKEAMERAEKLVEGQRLQGFLVNLLFSILGLIGLMSLWMVLGDLGSVSLNLTVYTLFFMNFGSVTMIFGNVAYTVYYFRCKEYQNLKVQQFGNFNYTALVSDIP